MFDFDTYILKSMSKGIDSPGSGDKLMIVRPATNSGSAANIDLSKVLKADAKVAYFQFKVATLSSGVLSSAAAVAGATSDIITVIIADSADVASA